MRPHPSVAAIRIAERTREIEAELTRQQLLSKVTAESLARPFNRHAWIVGMRDFLDVVVRSWQREKEPRMGRNVIARVNEVRTSTTGLTWHR